jgi:ribonuclease VapC
MIAIDTSALMAIALDEPEATACIAALEADDQILISAATVAESLIVAAHRRLGDDMARILDGFGFTVVAITAASAQRVAAAYARWGKGNHIAGLNFGDCFSYEVAKQHDCPLLYIGQDFSRTDVKGAL